MHWLAYWLGLTDAGGSPYLWWSGPGSDLGELALLGAVAGVFRHNNCHVHGCLRLGRHPHGPFKLCAKHHPGVPDRVTAAAVRAQL